MLIACIAVFCACNATKYVPEGDYLYTGATVKVKGDETSGKEQKRLSEEMENIMQPRPNRRFLGMPIRLWIYSFWGKPGEEKGLGNWISRTAGSAPVLMSSVRIDFQKDIIINRLQNRGYFQATVEMDSSATKRKIKLHYTADPGQQYLIDTVYFPTDSSVLATAIREISDKSFLIKDHGFDLDVIKAERERINARLKEQGFYYFASDDILILVDSTNQPYTVSLAVSLKPGASERAQERFTIDSIYIFPQHTLSAGDTLSMRYAEQYKDFVIVDSQDLYRPSLFERTLVFRHGDVYNRTNHNRSLNKLIDLGVFKYVENRFKETGNSQLDAYYYLTPYKKKSIRFVLSGRNTSTNFNGVEADVSWQNRNAFRGAENMKFNVYGGADFQFSGNSPHNNQYRFGAQINLSIPKFVTPFSVVTPFAYVPRTQINIGYDKLNRVGSYVLNSVRSSFGYQWKESAQKEHQFTVFSVNYIQPGNISTEYRDRIEEDPTLANAIQRQFIVGPGYNYRFTNTMDRSLKHTIYFNTNIDLSGNLPGLLSGADYRDGETRKIFGAEFAQYARVEGDLRYYNDLGRESVLAMRVFGGFGLPYGNSRAMPFVKQFFAGGTTGLRAFRARTLGPGTFRAEDISGTNTITADQTADIKLETNIEYRPHISGILKGAIFADAGNIWLFRTDTLRPGASFGSDFIREVAVDFGIGLRFDFSFFVLRTDLAIPLRKPWRPEGERWVIDEIAFGSSAWRRENLTFNLAIGYPF